MVKAAEEKDYVQSLERGLSVILAFSDHHPRLTLGELAELTGLSRPTVRRIVLTLEKLGYVRAEGRYFALTPHVLALGNAYLSSLNLTEVAQPYMEDVTKVTGHPCSLAALDGEDAVFLARIPSRRVMRHTLTTGTRLPAYATSMGRMLLAGLPDHEIEEFLRHGQFPRITARTVTDPARLREILHEVRRQGWALVDQEFEEGVRSFSAPVRDSGDRVIATLSMSVPAGTLSLAEIHGETLPVVVEAAREISKQLGAPAPR
ncbi:IclR family transcriptional regulator [Prauserella shujinwangii]|uniref:IclR family transcriptional regulator n=1 Tax=Prauserella shujinwangii TaxID=1453103 RepID=A0A2T0LN40_9PSEU|nr:IclR family transcriptional regulator C-terminal domain-containing protein [Prauserella shujinwangii]PRX44617.1 IclR family transcriptional regulator [Prauserella shujinwangii]